MSVSQSGTCIEGCINEGCTLMTYVNTLAADLRIYHTWRLGKNQGYFSWRTNHIAPQSIVLES